MADLKTKQNNRDVNQFLEGVVDDKKRGESRVLVELYMRATKKEPKMWGDSIIGFGSYHYRYASGREGDWLAAGFSPRKRSIAVYIMDGFEKYEELLEDLGKHTRGKGCLHIRKLEDVDLEALEKLVKASYDRTTGHGSADEREREL